MIINSYGISFESEVEFYNVALFTNLGKVY